MSRLEKLKWAAMAGIWEFEGRKASYYGDGQVASAGGQRFSVGWALTNLELRRGAALLRITIEDTDDPMSSGGLMIGYGSDNERYVLAQIGAANSAYAVSVRDPSFGWRPLYAAGPRANLRSGGSYELSVKIRGQRMRMDVDGVKVIDQILDAPLVGSQVGLSATGNGLVSFDLLNLVGNRAKVFVAMQFGEPYDTLYDQVIKPIAEGEMNLDVVRIDEVSKPGIIFKEIQEEISESDIIIAEITPTNANVFYELGYAHALNKPTILLARSGQPLPFDIRSYRVIFYDDTIGGKPVVEDRLRKYLRSILEDF